MCIQNTANIFSSNQLQHYRNLHSNSLSKLTITMANSGSRESQGTALQIVDFDLSKETFVLKMENINKILNNPKTRNYPLCVISMTGASRIGKSFTLSYFMRYLTTDSMGAQDEGLVGFEWTNSSTRQTIGIYAWSELFIRKNENGTMVAVMLLDTQGLFDGLTTEDNEIKLFAFSTMLSSVQLFNVQCSLQSDKLKYLKHFVEYGKKQNQVSENKKIPFQELIFLVRDWKHPRDYTFGATGGKKYIAKTFSPADRPQDQIDDRDGIKRCFQTVTGFLLPYPGEEIIEEDFDGRPEQLSRRFQEHLHALMVDLFHPRNIKIKDINGENAVPYSFSRFLMTIAVVFSASDNKNVGDVLDSGIVHGFMMSSISSATKQYMTCMKSCLEVCDFKIKKDELKAKHTEFENKAVFHFLEIVTTNGSVTMIEKLPKYKKILQNTITDLYGSYIIDHCNQDEQQDEHPEEFESGMIDHTNIGIVEVIAQVVEVVVDVVKAVVETAEKIVDFLKFW